ncbi:hypothetical protein DFH09DRAFT_1285222 [Mycena vulgaris]|nr:hypothetical protein DFH09DRAFT_1285222 [Mycena vulgaris]
MIRFLPLLRLCPFWLNCASRPLAGALTPMTMDITSQPSTLPHYCAIDEEPAPGSQDGKSSPSPRCSAPKCGPHILRRPTQTVPSGWEKPRWRGIITRHSIGVSTGGCIILCRQKTAREVAQWERDPHWNCECGGTTWRGHLRVCQTRNDALDTAGEDLTSPAEWLKPNAIQLPRAFPCATGTINSHALIPVFWP